MVGCDFVILFCRRSGVPPSGFNGMRYGEISLTPSHNFSGGFMYCVCGVQLYVTARSSSYICHNWWSRREFANSSLDASVMVPFHSSSKKFCSELCSIVVA